ncbi:hypothetical protein MN608_00984 [Microdochium nivale]|nr:hypothetical protein MN608_00984 [Microdochium nivale]
MPSKWDNPDLIEALLVAFVTIKECTGEDYHKIAAAVNAKGHGLTFEGLRYETRLLN